MTPGSVLVTTLALAALLGAVAATPLCTNRCCRFVEGFPVRLEQLRLKYSQIRDFYEANDDLDSALLDQSIEDSFKTPFACQAMDSILGFYLSIVLPTAVAEATEESRELMPHVETIQQIFHELKDEVTKCRNYFSCKKPFDIKDLNSTYTQMESKGLYKAMGELDVLFNFIERYLASKRQRNRVASG